MVYGSPTYKRVRGHWHQIEVAAIRFGLDPAVLGGLVAIESTGITWAYRAEPRYKWLVKAARRPSIIGRDTSIYMQRISYGLCQVMGAVAREHGFPGWLSKLYDPEVGLYYGAKHLAVCIKRAKGDLYTGLRRYNGHPRLPATARYAKKVLAHAEIFKKGLEQ